MPREKRTPLPLFIPLVDPAFPDEEKWVKKRNARCIRFHKFKKEKDSHQYYFSEMQLFLPHKKEEDLFPDDFDKCKELYLKNEEYSNAATILINGNVCENLNDINNYTVEDIIDCLENL